MAVSVKEEMQARDILTEKQVRGQRGIGDGDKAKQLEKLAYW